MAGVRKGRGGVKPRRVKSRQSPTVAGGVLTEIQAGVLAFIDGFRCRRQMPPTVREVMEEFGFTSTNGAYCHLLALARKGFLRRDGVPGRNRGLRTLVVAGRRDGFRVLVNGEWRGVLVEMPGGEVRRFIPAEVL